MSALVHVRLMPDSGPIRRLLHPPLEPYRSFTMKAGSLHTIYAEEAGSGDGIPVMCLHGGPGGGISPDMRRFFDPRRWRMILFDQRGCGRSTPHAELRENTTWDLVADMEALRVSLGIEKMVLFGGSWGSTLALAYAVTHPERVAGLILRGIFLVTNAEILWFYQSGASQIYPDAYDRYIAPIPEGERGDLLSAFHARLTAADRDTRITAARAWSRWEGDALSIRGPDARPNRFEDDRFVEAFARIECHYFTNGGFLPHDGWLLEQAGEKLKGIPGRIVHGRFDVLTPLASAWALKTAWPDATLEIVPDAGHASLEPGIVDGLVRACEDMAELVGRA
ncbi:MAG: prolyl aminopeptidase [Hyphomonadaceae bacterium]|nr:prolyl aminopeptidase [Hyphomonadaceae bacterium]